MGILKKTIIEITCDLCGATCAEDDRDIEIKTDSGDGRDVGPAMITGRLSYSAPYRVSDGIICVPCKKSWLTHYLARI